MTLSSGIRNQEIYFTPVSNIHRGSFFYAWLRRWLDILFK
jgi:hypothetical protein